MRQLAAQYNQLVAESALQNNLVVDPSALLHVQGANGGGQLSNLQSPIEGGRDSRHQPNPFTSTQIGQLPPGAVLAQNPNARMRGYGQQPAGTDGAGGERGRLLSGGDGQRPHRKQNKLLSQQQSFRGGSGPGGGGGSDPSDDDSDPDPYPERSKKEKEIDAKRRKEFRITSESILTMPRARSNMRCEVDKFERGKDLTIKDRINQMETYFIIGQVPPEAFTGRMQ